MTLTDQAIKLLVERGLPMLPSGGASKGPCVKWKAYQKRLPTAEQLREWGQQFKPRRWGFVTGSATASFSSDCSHRNGLFASVLSSA